MADKKSGPVKPPIIDAKARSGAKDDAPENQTTASASSQSKAGSTAKPDAATSGTEQGRSQSASRSATAQPSDKPGAEKPRADKPASEKSVREEPSPEKPHPAAAESRTSPLLSSVLAAGAGGLIGVALAYGLAAFGFWPGGDTGSEEALAALESRTSRIEDALGQQQAESENLGTRIDSLETDFSTRLEALSATVPDDGSLATQDDLSALSGRLDELATRVEAVAAGASDQEASEIASRIGQLSDTVAHLSARLDRIEPELDTIGPALEDAQARLDDLDARVVDQEAFEAVTAERNRLAQIPAALDALEQRIDTGESFSAQLADLEVILPDFTASDEAAAVAASGAPAQAALLRDFRAAIGPMLAARPRDSQANWAQSLLDDAAAAIALRPTDGEGPQAQVGRIEAALEAGDLATAQDGFTALPEQMQAAAPGFADALEDAVTARETLAAARAATPVQTGAEANQ